MNARSLLAVVALLLALAPIGLFPSSLHAARGAGGGKTEVLPLQKTAPAAVVIETTGSEQDLRKQLRAKTGVTELTQAKTPFSQASVNSFGFIGSQPLGMALVTQSPDLLIERVAPVAQAFEVHKLADGSGLLVGFVSKDLLPQITPANRPHTVRIAVYSSPSDKAPYIAAVPLVKLMVDRMPVKLEPKRPDSPVMLDMDLQSSANRKSIPGSQ